MIKFLITGTLVGIVCLLTSCRPYNPDNKQGNNDQLSFENSSDPSGEKFIQDSLFLKGIIAYRSNKYADAYDFFTKSMHQADSSGNILLKANCLEQLGSLNLTLGDDNLALKMYYEALPLFELKHDKGGIAKVYNIIGVYKGSQGEYDTARYYFSKAMELNEEIGNQTGLIHNKGNLAFMFYDMGNTEQAKAVYISLIPKLLETGDSINLSVIYYHLSMFSETASQPDSMMLYLRKSLSVSEKIADTSILTTLYGKIGQIHLNRHQYDSAFYLLTKSEELAKSINDYVTQKQVLKLLVSLDTLMGNYKKATSRYAALLIASDSVYKQKLRNSLEASELKYENQKKNNLIELQQKLLENESGRKRLYRSLLYISLMATFFLIMIILLVIKNNIKKKKILQDQIGLKELKIESTTKDEIIHKLRIENLENEIRIKEREQVSSAMSLEQKNELLGMINEKIKEAMASDGILSIPALNGIVGHIREQLKDSSKLDMFNQQFSRLHPDFFEKLKTDHPGLTKSELKFCAFLKLKLSSHQISSILNVSSEAIRKSRYRIRKKMNLPRETALDDYISKF